MATRAKPVVQEMDLRDEDGPLLLACALAMEAASGDGRVSVALPEDQAAGVARHLLALLGDAHVIAGRRGCDGRSRVLRVPWRAGWELVSVDVRNATELRAMAVR